MTIPEIEQRLENVATVLEKLGTQVNDVEENVNELRSQLEVARGPAVTTLTDSMRAAVGADRRPR
jgi:predicted  nucleic acid-binding Zn-ribbon protein